MIINMCNIICHFILSILTTLSHSLLEPPVENPASGKAAGTWQTMQQLVRDEGFATLYRGLVPVLQSLWISNFVYFYSFHTLKALCTSPPTPGGAGGVGSTAFRDLCLGTVAGITNVLISTPFWVVATRMKMNNALQPQQQQADASSAKPFNEYANMMQGLRYIWRTEGTAGLWAGSMSSLMLVSNPALQFMAYESLKRQLAAMTATTHPPPAVAFFVLGAVAKAFATVATYPLQLIQTKLRHGGGGGGGATSSSPAGVLEMFVQILKAHGVEGLFRGLEAKLLQTVLTAALMFAAYEKIAGVVLSLLMRSKRNRPN